MGKDLEAMDRAIKRVYEHMRIQPHETGVEAMLMLLREELAEEINKAQGMETIK